MSGLRDPRPGSFAGHLGALWDRRDLVLEFARRDLNVRYRGTVLGVLWTFVNPLLTMGVLTAVFSLAMKGSVAHYPAFFLCGQLPWLFFAGGLAGATRSLSDHAALIKRAAFPRAVFPLSASLAGFVHLLVSMPLLFGFLLALGVPVHASWAWLPVPLAVLLGLVAGLSLLLSAWSTRLRDLEQLVPILLNVWFFATPIFYPLVDDAGKAFVPESLQPYFRLNPMAGVVLTVRDVLLSDRAPDPLTLAPSAVFALAALVAGFIVFFRAERTIAENV